MARLICPLYKSAAISSREAACILPDRSVLYKELEYRVRAVSEQLSEQGLVSGDVVAVAIDSGLSYITYLFAALRCGIILAPLNTRLPQSALDAQVEALGAKHFIREDVLDAKGLSGELDNPQYTVEQTATLLFTSGSSRQPKIVQHSFGAHYYSALGSNHHMKLQSGDRWLLSLPLYHVGGIGIVFRCVLAGASIVLPAAGEPIADALLRTQCTHVSLVPTQLKELLAHPELSSLREQLKVILLGGAAISHELLQAAYAADLPVLPTYGLTEMASQVTSMPLLARKRKLGSAGVVLAHRELRLSSENRIQLRGKTLFDGYLNQGVLEQPFDREGWFTTGDLGGIDDEDYLWIQGRADRLFISGGENINPQEIEALLEKAWPKTQFAVVPVADEKFGERPVLFVAELEEGVETAELLDCLEGKLPRYKIPVAVWAWPEDLRGGMKVPLATLKARADLLYSNGSA